MGKAASCASKNPAQKPRWALPGRLIEEHGGEEVRDGPGRRDDFFWVQSGFVIVRHRGVEHSEVASALDDVQRAP